MSFLQSPAYTDAEVAELYDVLNPWGAGDDFYLDLVMRAGAVLDVGCGTGAILNRARAEGHTGTLVGVDPEPAMLAVARRGPDIAWHESTAAAMPWDAAFDLALMTGNAFQCLVGDDDLAASLAAIRRALRDGGTFAFDTRNPAAREWEEWHRGDPIEAVDPGGRPVRVSYEILAVQGDVVTLTETTGDRDGRPLRVDEGRLRFLDPDALAAALTAARFAVEARYGGWDGRPFAAASRQVVVIARTT